MGPELRLMAVPVGKKYPEVLTEADLKTVLAAFPEEVRADRGRRIFSKATVALSYFLGTDWVTKHVIQDGGSPDGYMRLKFDTDQNREARSARIVEFAETLFNLQHIEGFHGRIESLRTGDIKQIESTVAEFDFARFLYLHDVALRFVDPTGVRGQDYDCLITYGDGRIACADAKCRLEASETKVSTIRHQLEKARKLNLPEDKPGIVFLKLPQVWIETAGRQKEIADAVRDFLRKTKRLVGVVVYTTVVIVTDQILTRHAFLEIENPEHRFDRSKRWTLFKDYVVPPEWRGKHPKWINVISQSEFTEPPTDKWE